jgi:hypothetical protein
MLIIQSRTWGILGYALDLDNSAINRGDELRKLYLLVYLRRIKRWYIIVTTHLIILQN